MILDLETNVAASPLADRTLELQETPLPERAKKGSLASALASGIEVVVAAPL